MIRFCPLVWIASLTLVGSSCSSESEPVAPAPTPTALTYEDIVATRLAEVCAPQTAREVVDPADADQVQGLLQTLLDSHARFQKVAREELLALGESARVRLANWLVPEPADLAPELLHQAVQLLGAEGLRDLDTLVTIATSGRLEVSPYTLPVRREALYQLGLMKDDRALLRLIRHLKYEKDPENFLWLGWALLELGNGSGVPALYDLTRSEDPDLAARTQATLQQAAQARGTTPEALLPTWIAGDPDVWPTPNVSPELRCLVWQEIEATAGEHFQMRGIDDARNQLKGLGTWVAAPLAEATRDKDMYVRLHAAQILQRLGPRGRDAVDALERLLPDPTAGPTAAAALGAIGTPQAYEALSRAIHPGSARPLQVAALQAMAFSAEPTGGGDARTLWQSAQAAHDEELAIAAAGCLLRTQPDAPVLSYLSERLPQPDGAFIEGTLDRWIRSFEAREPEDEDLLTSYRQVREAPLGIPSMEVTLAHRRRFQAWLEQNQAALLRLAGAL